MMTLEQLMLDLLNNNCRNYEDPDGAYYVEHGSYDDYDGYYRYEIELHCMTATIIAKPTTRDAEGLPTGYDIKSVDWRDS